MFAPEQKQFTKEEIEAGEREATRTIQTVIAGAVLLYLSPFAVDWVRKLL